MTPPIARSASNGLAAQDPQTATHPETRVAGNSVWLQVFYTVACLCDVTSGCQQALHPSASVSLKDAVFHRLSSKVEMFRHSSLHSFRKLGNRNEKRSSQDVFFQQPCLNPQTLTLPRSHQQRQDPEHPNSDQTLNPHKRCSAHVGPTNSGKTYNALQALKTCETGLYCGPLRLLALEAYDTLNAAGEHSAVNQPNFAESSIVQPDEIL